MDRPAPKPVRRAALLALAVALTLGLAPAASAHHRAGPCDVHRLPGETVVHHSKELIRCATAKWPVPGGAGRAVCIADRESGLVPTAASPGGDFLGLFQHMASAWPDRYTAWTWPGWQLKDDALNGRTNTIVTIRMANDGGWGPWGALGC
ncbi:MAG: hypothetical protein ACXWZU_09185 [Actinomycetota bacterium]